MYKLSALFPVLILTILFLWSCNKPDDARPLTRNIYLVGMRGGSATYWKNDSAILLRGGLNWSYGSSIAVSGGDVYVAGFQYNTGGRHVATVWKNGAATTLSDGSADVDATGIALQGSDAYVVGSEIAANGKPVAVYWKNGVRIPLGAGVESECTGIALSGQDVYIAGYRKQPGGGRFHCYWKNGVLYYPSDTLRGIDGPLGITVSGSNVYMVWTDSDGGFEKRIYTSKNSGPATAALLEGNGSAAGTTILVRDTDVFIGGWGFAPGTAERNAKYWKNGKVKQLADGNSAVVSLAVDGEDIFAAGWASSASSNQTPVIWKNGVATTLAPFNMSGVLNQVLIAWE